MIVPSACISELIGYAGDLGMGGFCQFGLHSMVVTYEAVYYEGVRE